jgi:hypothetical protein
MITPQDLARAFALNLSTAQEQAKGLTHTASLCQPPFQGNCLNWVLGHMVETRNGVLKLLGQSGILTEAQSERYGYGSEPVCADGEDVLRLEELLALLERGQAGIEAGLAAMSPADLEAPAQSFLGTTTRGYLLFFYNWHETYHLGQLELLRELASSVQ